MSEFDLRGAVLEDRYAVVERIAEGAMGSVWRGERVKLGKAVAIKIMHEELPDELASRQRFEREAKLMARLEHPNCVSVIDFGVHEGKPYLVMDLVRGTSLQDVIDREQRIEQVRAAEILRQVLSGLGHAHELGIVHRDIKPANIMIGEATGIDLQVRILDFGLARPTQTSTKLTTGIVVGTPNYMAPEQCRGGDLDGRADIYACGVMLFEMLSGRKPFLADDPIAVVRMHMTAPPPKVSDVAGLDVGADLEAVVATALAKDPNARFASTTEMTKALDAAVASRRSFAHAIPHRIASQPGIATGPTPMATMSGWNVPPPGSDAIQLTSSALEAVQSTQLPPQSMPLPVPSLQTGPVPLPAPMTPSGPTSGVVQVPETTAPSGRLFQGTGPASTSPSAPKLPFSRRQIAIAGGGLLAVVILIAIVAGSGSKSTATPPPRDAAVTQPGSDITIDPATAALNDANQRLDSGDREGALQVLLKGRRDYPQDGGLAFLAGRVYFAKLYWTDGIKAFRDAIRIDPAYRGDPELIKTALRGFITTPSVERELESFLREDIGAAAIPYLEETAKEHPNATIRARAAAELKRMR